MNFDDMAKNFFVDVGSSTIDEEQPLSAYKMDVRESNFKEFLIDYQKQ